MLKYAIIINSTPTWMVASKLYGRSLFWPIALHLLFVIVLSFSHAIYCNTSECNHSGIELRFDLYASASSTLLNLTT